MVKYYGRARQRTGSVNTNQTGLKMAGCPSTVGRRGVINRYIARRVNCAMGVCNSKGIVIHGWPRPKLLTFRNKAPYCVAPSSKCLAAAGGIRTTYVPYYRTNHPGQAGCFKKGLTY